MTETEWLISGTWAIYQYEINYPNEVIKLESLHLTYKAVPSGCKHEFFKNLKKCQKCIWDVKLGRDFLK